MSQPEMPSRIEPARIEQITERLADAIARLVRPASILGNALHPHTAASLADVVRVMNTYYSNLIEGHDTRPRDIELALAGELDNENARRRNLQLEAAAHVRVQRLIDEQAMAGTLPEPASCEFLRWVHHEFYRDAPEELLIVHGAGREFRMQPGEWRSRPEHDNAVGRHQPPASKRVDDFMRYFETRFAFSAMGESARILAIAIAHHRFNYIHPFPDGNGRVSRLMSHAMAHKAGVGAHGLWSVSRGLARGLASRTEYKANMDLADSPRHDDLDGRGNLSLADLNMFVEWFLDVCIDQVTFMAEMFDLDGLRNRFERLVHALDFKPESKYLLEAALLQGEFERGEASRLTGLPERSARRVLKDLVDRGLLGSDGEKRPVSLRFPADSLDLLFPRLYPST
ncbi:MAG TPA: Fic family protein [Gammaproteobacteria bacterium]